MARKSNLFLICLALGGISFILLFFHAVIGQRNDLPGLLQNQGLVKTLELTDLCLFTEARYMRHPSQADLHSAFQDHPTSFEHFPAGSFGSFRGETK
jgi:hypothetical protein